MRLEVVSALPILSTQKSCAKFQKSTIEDEAGKVLEM